MFRKTSLLLAALLAAGATAAAAEPQPAPRAVPVHVGDLDLRTQTGARLALQRIHAAAHVSCGEETDLRRLDRQAVIEACVRQAVERTVASAHSPMLAAVAGAPAQTALVAAR
jgi:UrcA family protein